MRRVNDCHFCGSKTVSITDLTDDSVLTSTFLAVCVECENCNSRGPVCTNRNEAIIAWNKATVYENIEDRDEAISVAVCDGLKPTSSFVRGWKINL